MDKIKSYFERHPHSTEVFEAKGKLFHTQGAAQSFSSDVKRHTRKMVETKEVESQETSDDEHPTDSGAAQGNESPEPNGGGAEGDSEEVKTNKTKK